MTNGRRETAVVALLWLLPLVVGHATVPPPEVVRGVSGSRILQGVMVSRASSRQLHLHPALTQRTTRSPAFSNNFKGFDFHFDDDFFGVEDNELIPLETRDQFTPPVPADKQARLHQIFGNSLPLEEPPHAHIVLLDEPFFDTLDHAKLIFGLQQLRRRYKLPPLRFKSLRPYFPFFVSD